MEFLTETQVAWLPALLQLISYMLILLALSVLIWWGSIVVSDLIKQLRTGAGK